ncbi:MAG: RNA methyltransferase [Clostridiales bacterium]|nr:RNA methyltransferase [Clostridiales bacterium]
MEIIKSADNRTVKHISKLKDKKYRDEYNEFFAEGYKNVLDTVTARPELVKSVVLSESSYADCGEKFCDFNTVVIADNVFDKITDTKTCQGVLCVMQKPKSVLPKSDCCIMLDRVRDPGNVGTILRTAVACGYDVMANNCADVYSPKVIRSAMSAAVKCNIGVDISVDDIKKSGYSLIVADMHGENVFKSNCGGKYCIVVGNEAEGVSDEIKAQADKLLALPQSNMESLNAAVAAAVMMFVLKFGQN